ncbi:MAG: acyl-CoA/acyl-ACP dehydrogenase [Deltaproteobacteria bacterium]|nr:acyl-CoA/acyl-ACP dehydrogenase [Deltaproteobacteria bacterium]
MALAVEEVAKYCCASGLILLLSALPTQPIVIGGTEDQKQAWLPKIARGEAKAAYCLTEPNAGSDAAALQTRAEEQGGDFYLSGQKVFISGVDHSSYGMVVARTAPPTSKKTEGISIFLVDLSSPGVEILPLWTIADWKVYQVFFDKVRVPANMLMGRKNEGWKHIVKETLNFERSSMKRVGTAARMCDDLFSFVREAKRHGETISQSLLHELVDLKTEIESWRVMSYRIAWLQSRGEIPGPETSMVKLASSEGILRLANLGMDIIGHAGRLRSGTETLPGRIEWMYRAAQFHITAGGTSEIQRNVIARLALDLPRA